ncbi:MAG: YfiT family bacillithiol transferase [Acidobacteriota bacterium]
MSSVERYPIGPLRPPKNWDAARREKSIKRFEHHPRALRAAASGLEDDQLDTPYRPAGWTLRQVVHHLADSHLNGYIRFKLALTETRPTIRPYDQEAWAALPDSATDIGVSLDLLDAVHRRWSRVMRAMEEADWQRELIHPEEDEVKDLTWALALYTWHGEHHRLHITGFRQRRGW